MTKKESYIDFLNSKIKVAEKKGFKIDSSFLHPSTKPHQADIIVWALELSRALIAADCGLGKTHMAIEISRCVVEHIGGKALIVTELGASDTFCNPDPYVGDGARLGINLEYITNTQEAINSECDIIVTNYERVRMGDIDFSKFSCVVLDEGNYIKNMASETTDSLARELKKVVYKYIATATPSPNEILELINYAHVLGIADRGQILTQFFQRNSTKAGDLTIHPQHEQDFWLWVYSWMVAIETPSDLGYSDEGYELPELEIIWHELELNKAFDAGKEKNGQGKMYLDSGNNLPDNAKLKRETVKDRVNKAMELLSGYDPDTHFILWHHLEDERKEIEQRFKGNKNYASLYGSLKLEQKENIIVDFTKGDLQLLGTKPSMSAVGCNFQKHCNTAIMVGIDNDFNLLYQLIKRIHRFGQKHKCTLHIIYLREEYPIVQNLKRKWKQHNEQRQWLRSMVKKFGLDYSKMIEERRRTFKMDRKEYTGERFTLVNTDAVYEWMNLPDCIFDYGNSSFPFGNHYEYTNKYNDFGHNTSNREFFDQMDFLIPELYRTWKPGRIFTVHLKNRIHYGSVTGKGFSVFHRFTHMVCEAMEKHGWETMGFHYIPTCVVGENNQTYRLTYGEMQKDSTKMGSGIPEEIWVFRKPPTSTANAYADEPVKHNCECPCCHDRKDYDSYVNIGSILLTCPKCRQSFHEIDLIRHSNQQLSLAHWQIDADSLWKTSGNRYLSPTELATWDLKRIRKWWNEFDSKTVYDYDGHVELLRQLERVGKLSKEFTTLPLLPNTDYVWQNINRMQGLNLEQSRRKQQNHICPQPYDEVDRCIELYSNEGDYVADPFGGLGTTGVRALKKGRKAFLTELNDTYAFQSSKYLKEAEELKFIPSLFDLIEN